LAVLDQPVDRALVARAGQAVTWHAPVVVDELYRLRLIVTNSYPNWSDQWLLPFFARRVENSPIAGLVLLSVTGTVSSVWRAAVPLMFS
jgi:hypothetical protein